MFIGIDYRKAYSVYALREIGLMRRRGRDSQSARHRPRNRADHPPTALQARLNRHIVKDVRRVLR